MAENITDSDIPDPTTRGSTVGPGRYAIIRTGKHGDDVVTEYDSEAAFRDAIRDLPYRPPGKPALGMAARTDVVAKAQATIQQVYRNPALKTAIDNVAQLTGYPIQGLYSLVAFESSGGTNMVGGGNASGPLQFMDSTYHFDVARYAQADMENLRRFAPEAARAFESVLPYMKIGYAKGTTTFTMDEHQWKLDGHPISIADTLAPHKDNPSVQFLFTVRDKQAHTGLAGNPYYMRAVHTFGADGARELIDAWAHHGHEPIHKVRHMSREKLAQNNIARTDMVANVYERYVTNPNEVTNEIGRQLGVTPVDFKPSIGKGSIVPAAAAGPIPVSAGPAPPDRPPGKPKNPPPAYRR